MNMQVANTPVQWLSLDLNAFFASYEQQMADRVRRSRGLARTMAKTIVPSSAAGVWVLAYGAQLISMLPAGLTKALAKLNAKGVRLYDSMQYKDYSALVVG